MADPRATIIRETLRERGIKHTWLAAQLGTSKWMLSKILSDDPKHALTHDFARRAFVALDLPVSLLAFLETRLPDGTDTVPVDANEAPGARRTA